MKVLFGTMLAALLSVPTGALVESRRAWLGRASSAAVLGQAVAPAGAVVNPQLSFTTTSSGLKLADFRVGEGEAVGPSSRVTFHCVGRLVGRQGWIFENSREDDDPYRLELGKGQVIRGLEEGMQGMKVGGIRRLIIPSELACTCRPP